MTCPCLYLYLYAPVGQLGRLRSLHRQQRDDAVQEVSYPFSSIKGGALPQLKADEPRPARSDGEENRALSSELTFGPILSNDLAQCPRSYFRICVHAPEKDLRRHDDDRFVGRGIERGCGYNKVAYSDTELQGWARCGKRECECEFDACDDEGGLEIDINILSPETSSRPRER